MALLSIKLQKKIFSVPILLGRLGLYDMSNTDRTNALTQLMFAWLLLNLKP